MRRYFTPLTAIGREKTLSHNARGYTMATNRRRNLAQALRHYCEENCNRNRRSEDGPSGPPTGWYQYEHDVGVLLRVLMTEFTDDQICESIDSLGLTGPAYRTVVNILRRLHNESYGGTINQ